MLEQEARSDEIFMTHEGWLFALPAALVAHERGQCRLMVLLSTFTQPSATDTEINTKKPYKIQQRLR